MRPCGRRLGGGSGRGDPDAPGLLFNAGEVDNKRADQEGIESIRSHQIRRMIALQLVLGTQHKGPERF